MANDETPPGNQPNDRPGFGPPPDEPTPDQTTDWYRPVEEPTSVYPEAPPPSVTIPAAPPPATPQPIVPPAAPVAAAAAPPPPEEDDQPTRTSELGWKVATLVAVLLAAGALIWGFMQKDNAEELAANQGAALQNAQEQIDADLMEEEELQKQLSRAQAAHDRVEEKLQTKKRDLQEEAAQLRSLRDELQTAEKNAAQEEATLRDEVRAAQRRADLATKCAQVMATGLRVIYDAETPQEVMDDVVKEMELAAESCAGVVSVG